MGKKTEEIAIQNGLLENTEVNARKVLLWENKIWEIR